MLKKVTLHSLQFEHIPVRYESETGDGVVRYERVGMPKIPSHVIRCAFYLYATEDDAKQGLDPGGTGFFIVVNTGKMDHVYAVSNWHTAVDDSDPESPPCPVIRYSNGEGSSTHVIDLKSEDWHFIEGHSDLAIAPIVRDETHSIVGIPAYMFIGEDDGRGELIDVGDDVFMIGLFADHDGRDRVVPAARFGHISVMPNPDCPIEQPNAGHAEAYVLDVHSRSGFSGSPVFVYRTFGADLTFDPDFDISAYVVDPRDRTPEIRISTRQSTIFKFLGVHFSQFPEEWQIGKRPASEGRTPRLISDSEYVAGFSGMTCVVPAWRLFDLINIDVLVKQREAAAMKKKRGGPVPERSKSPRAKTDENLADADIVKRRDEAVRKALATPPSPLKSRKSGARKA